MTDNLVQFLRDRLDDDESIAREAAHYEAGHWTTKDGYPVSVADELPETADTFERVVAFDEGSPSEEQAAHIARHDPARVLVDVTAKRQILEWHRKPTADEFDDGTYRTMGCRCYDGWPCTTLRALALPFADHPKYKQEWRP